MPLLQDEGLDDLIADEGDELPSAADLHKVRLAGLPGGWSAAVVPA